MVVVEYLQGYTLRVQGGLPGISRDIHRGYKEIMGGSLLGVPEGSFLQIPK